MIITEQTDKSAKKLIHLENKLRLEAMVFLANPKIYFDEIQREFSNLSRSSLINLLNELKKDYNYINSALKLQIFNDLSARFILKDQVLQDPNLDKFTAGKDLSPNEIKTLAFICYFQPVEAQEVYDLIGRGSKLAVKNLKKRDFIKENRISYSILNENSEEIQKKVSNLSTTPTLAHYLNVRNDPEIIRNYIEKNM